MRFAFYSGRVSDYFNYTLAYRSIYQSKISFKIELTSSGKSQTFFISQEKWKTIYQRIWNKCRSAWQVVCRPTVDCFEGNKWCRQWVVPLGYITLALKRYRIVGWCLSVIVLLWEQQLHRYRNCNRCGCTLDCLKLFTLLHDNYSTNSDLKRIKQGIKFPPHIYSLQFLQCRAPLLYSLQTT